MKVCQIVLTDIPEEIRICMKTVEDIYPQVEVFKKKSDKIGLELIKESDNWRVEILSNEDNIIYIDFDIELYDSFKIENNWLLSCNYYKGQPDYSVIYSPKKEIWKEIEMNRLRRGIERTTYAWLRKVLREMKINEIQGNYRHLRYSSGQKKCKNAQKIAAAK